MTSGKLTISVRLAKSIVKYSDDEQMAKINILDGQMSRFTQVLTVDLQLDATKGIEAMNALLVSLNEPIQRLADHSSTTNSTLEDVRRLNFLRWLSTVPFSSHHRLYLRNRLPNTGRWLLQHSSYLHWRSTSSSSISLLYGLMGSGKTSLTSAVVDSFLKESLGHASLAPTAYFYCAKNSAETARSNPDEILRSIVRQMTVSQGSISMIHERVLREYERWEAEANVHGFDITKLEAEECVRLILRMTAANPATIILDAVDEVQSASRHVLISALNQVVRESLSVVKVFLSSRDDSNVLALLPHADTLRIRGEYNQEDIKGICASGA